MKLAASVSNFTPAPEGTTQGVLCDIVDLGLQEDKFNEGKLVHKMQFVFQTEETTEDGIPFTVKTYPVTASTNKKANAYKFIKTLLGRELSAEDFTDGEVDLDELILGKNAMITVTHNQAGEKLYANVTEIASIPTKIKDRLEVRDYVRVKDRAVEEEGEEKAVAATASHSGEPVKAKAKATEEELNF